MRGAGQGRPPPSWQRAFGGFRDEEVGEGGRRQVQVGGGDDVRREERI